MPAPYDTCSGTEDVPQWLDTVHNGISWPCCTYYRRQRCVKHSFMLPSSFPSVALSHQFLKPTENHLPCTLQGPCAFSCLKREANQAAAATPSCLAALPGGLTFPPQAAPGFSQRYMSHLACLGLSQGTVWGWKGWGSLQEFPHNPFRTAPRYKQPVKKIANSNTHQGKGEKQGGQR